jgi:hypothetical protein
MYDLSFRRIYHVCLLQGSVALVNLVEETEVSEVVQPVVVAPAGVLVLAKEETFDNLMWDTSVADTASVYCNHCLTVMPVCLMDMTHI